MAAFKVLAYSISGPGIDPGTTFVSATLAAERLIGQIIGVLTIVAFVYFALQLIFAGYSFFTSEGDKGKIEASRKRITEGILGIFIIVVSLGLAALLASLAGLKNIFDLNAMFDLMKL